jgi:hypothetical protein
LSLWPKKTFIKVLRGTFLALLAQNPFLTLKMIDPAFANKHQSILRKKLA